MHGNKKTTVKSTFIFILMIFHSSWLKIIAEMKIPNSNCGKTAAFTFNNGIHFARNLSQDTFQCMENQQITC